MYRSETMRFWCQIFLLALMLWFSFPSMVATAQPTCSWSPITGHLVQHARPVTLVVTRDNLEWHTVPISEMRLAKKVTALRRGLDAASITRGLGRIDAPANGGFDVATANELYRLLFGPVEHLIKDKKHLILVPSSDAGGSEALDVRHLLRRPSLRKS